MIFDVNTGKNFRRKASFVTDGQNTKTKVSMTYSSMVPRESVWIEMTIDALNGLEILD